MKKALSRSSCHKPSPPDPLNPPATVKSASQAQAAKRRNQKDEELVNRVLYLIITVLLCLVVRDVFHVQHLRQRVRDNELYVKAVRSSSEAWVTGWKLEELQSKLHTQSAVLRSLMMTLHHPFLYYLGSSLRGAQPVGKPEGAVVSDLYAHIENATAMHTWTCEDRPDWLVRIGQHDFFDSTPENCLVYSAGGGASNSIGGGGGGVTMAGPNAVFEVVDLGDGYVGLRSFANGKFVKVTPPASGKSSDPWSVDLASPVAGLAERFRIEPGGRLMLYNELLQGHLKCAGNNQAQAAPVLGVSGTSAVDLQYKPEYHFHLRRLTDQEVQQARLLKAMAKDMNRKAYDQISSFHSSPSSLVKVQYEALSAKERLEQEGARIALLIPITSKATRMSEVKDSPFFRNTLLSFLQTIDWQANKFSFTFFLGFDQGDALYDTGDAWTDMRQAFADHIRAYLSETHLRDAKDTERVMGQQLSLRLKHFRGKEGSPSQVVSELAREAYHEGFDYFFQVNDDTVFKSQDWPTIFTRTLAESPLLANLGVTGPFDTNNPRILTHAFVHRTHLDIHEARFFPQVFTNWWSDDWISAVYGRLGTFRAHSVTVLHDIHAQKLGNTVQRYKVDESAQLQLRGEVLNGMIRVNAFLASKGRPRLPLPDVCGYVPLVEEVYHYLQAEQHEHDTKGRKSSEQQAVRSKLQHENMVQYEIQKHPPQPPPQASGAGTQSKEEAAHGAAATAGSRVTGGGGGGGGGAGGAAAGRSRIGDRDGAVEEEDEEDDFSPW